MVFLMRYFKLILLSSCVLLTIQLQAQVVLPSNKTKFESLFNSKAGSYTLLNGDPTFCDSGQLKWLDDTQPDLGFSLGNLITFNGLHNGTQTNKVPNFCLVTTKFKYTSEGITMALRHDRCDNPEDSLDSSQTLRFLAGNKLQYTVEDTDVMCNFELQRL